MTKFFFFFFFLGGGGISIVHYTVFPTKLLRDTSPSHPSRIPGFGPIGCSLRVLNTRCDRRCDGSVSIVRRFNNPTVSRVNLPLKLKLTLTLFLTLTDTGDLRTIEPSYCRPTTGVTRRSRNGNSVYSPKCNTTAGGSQISHYADSQLSYNALNSVLSADWNIAE